MLGQGEGIARPAAFVVRHRIGVAGQQQAAAAFADAGQQVEFVARLRHRLYVDAKAQSANHPASKLINASLL